MKNGEFRITGKNSPKRSSFSPCRIVSTSLTIDIQAFMMCLEFSKKSFEFSKDNEEEVHFNNLLPIREQMTILCIGHPIL